MKPAESLEFLMYENTDASEILYKAIKSALSSARQILKVEDNLLNFKLLSVEQGQKLKRYRPGSRGNAKPINRRMSHIKIILEVRSVNKVDKKVEIKQIVNKEISNIKDQKSKTKLKIEKSKK